MTDSRKFDRRITFQKASESQDATGQPARDFASPDESFDRWAQRIDPRRPMEQFLAGQPVALTTVTWRVQDDSNTRTVTAHERWRIVFGSQAYDIKGVTPSLDRGEFIDFMAQARADA